MKTYIFFIAALFLQQSQAKELPIGTYGLHLFFDEKEFVDVLTLSQSETGELKGHMDVPNDFAGDIDNIALQNKKISFDLFVPKNAARPQDMIFHYRGAFFSQDYRQLIGYVTIKGQPEFIASFTAFLRER